MLRQPSGSHGDVRLAGSVGGFGLARDFVFSRVQEEPGVAGAALQLVDLIGGVVIEDARQQVRAGVAGAGSQAVHASGERVSLRPFVEHVAPELFVSRRISSVVSGQAGDEDVVARVGGDFVGSLAADQVVVAVAAEQQAVRRRNRRSTRHFSAYCQTPMGLRPRFAARYAR